MPKRRSETNVNSPKVKIGESKFENSYSPISTKRRSAFAQYSSEPKSPVPTITRSSPGKQLASKKSRNRIGTDTSNLLSPSAKFATDNSVKENFQCKEPDVINIVNDLSSDGILSKKGVLETKDNVVNDSLEIASDNTSECESNNLKILPILENRSQVILGIKNGAKHVKVYGCGYIKVIKGSLDVLGHNLTTESKEEKYYAPVTHCALVFQPIEYKKEKCKFLPSSLNQMDDKDLCKSVTDIIENFDVILLLTTATDEMRSERFPGYPDIYKVRTSDGEILRELCAGSYIVKTEKYFECFPAYQSSCYEILSYVNEYQKHNSMRNPVILTAGGKNVGKSTYNRYLINKLLGKFDKVYYLECDIGQPEFTPSGFIALSSVTSPILGPPFTHIQSPDFSVYHGNINASGEPDDYIQSIKSVFNKVASVNFPIVINTMGWNRALGLNLLVATIKIVQPTHIVQIAAQKDSRNLPNLDKHYLHQSEGWLINETDIQDYNHLMMKIDIKISEITMYNPSDLRNLRLLAYLNNLIKSCCKRDEISSESRSCFSTLCSLKPYSVKLSDVMLCVAHETGIPRTRALSLFNAQLVGLCHVDKEILKNHKNDKCLPLPPVCDCVGLGIVRGVDIERGVLYVISHLPKCVLEKVNCLTMGVLNIPECIHQRHEKEFQGERLPPYVTEDFPFQVTGSSKFRVYRNFMNKT